jgi:hypothetical protein
MKYCSIKFNYFLLVVDISFYVIWAGFFIYFMVNDDIYHLYFSTHRYLISRLIATLTLIKLTEKQYNFEKKYSKSKIFNPSVYWWYFAGFSFALCYDSLNLFVLIFRAPQDIIHIYISEIVVGACYLALSIVMWVFYVINYKKDGIQEVQDQMKIDQPVKNGRIIFKFK